jgi:hypothetical protein
MSPIVDIFPRGWNNGTYDFWPRPTGLLLFREVFRLTGTVEHWNVFDEPER